jgi:hypothetical protein
MVRDMLENWQSEFLQLPWQFGGLAMFLYVGSPQSEEGDDRKEAQIDPAPAERREWRTGDSPPGPGISATISLRESGRDCGTFHGNCPNILKYHVNY